MCAFERVSGIGETDYCQYYCAQIEREREREKAPEISKASVLWSGRQKAKKAPGKTQRSTVSTQLHASVIG